MYVYWLAELEVPDLSGALGMADVLPELLQLTHTFCD